jgi:hypothetical protein
MPTSGSATNLPERVFRLNTGGRGPFYIGLMKRLVEVRETKEKPEYSFIKEKLPKAFSFPLKRSILDAALDEASVRTQVYSVRYMLYHHNQWGRRKDGFPILEVLFSPELKGNSDSAYGKSLITVWAVPSQERKQCEGVLIETGLPHMCQWLERASVAGNVWRSTAHMLSLNIRDGVLNLEDS